MQQLKTYDINDIFPASVGVLGATGSVGTQAIDVIRAHCIPVDFLTAHRKSAYFQSFGFGNGLQKKPFVIAKDKKRLLR